MNQIIQNKRTLGFLLVILGASFWGIGGTVAQRLFQQDNLEVGWLVSSRSLLAGLLLIAIYKMTHRHESIFVIWRTKQNAFRQILFSLLGMLAVQYTYMMSIAIGNSAVATLLQYLAPLFIMAYYFLTRQSPLTKQDGIAVSLTLVGTFLLLTNGSFSTLSVPFMAVLWGILSGRHCIWAIAIWSFICAAFHLEKNNFFIHKIPPSICYYVQYSRQIRRKDR